MAERHHRPRIVDPPVFLDEVALAARWNVSRRTVQQWRYRGVGPEYSKIMGAVRYPLAEIERYERENRITPFAEKAGA